MIKVGHLSHFLSIWEENLYAYVLPTTTIGNVRLFTATIDLHITLNKIYFQLYT